MEVHPALRGFSRSANNVVYSVLQNTVANGGESSDQMLTFRAGLVP